jgi:hypothetical protein
VLGGYAVRDPPGKIAWLDLDHRPPADHPTQSDLFDASRHPGDVGSHGTNDAGMAGKLGIPWPICGGIAAEHLGPHDASVNGRPERAGSAAADPGDVDQPDAARRLRRRAWSAGW